jgi:hypothetical protein
VRLLYSGAPACSFPTLKRLMVLGKTLCFADRPSVSLGSRGFAGTVGFESPFKRIDTSGEPVTIEVFIPPSGPAKAIYHKFIEADFSNPKFIEIVVGGLRSCNVFASKLVQLQATYGDDLTGAMIRDAVTSLAPIPESIEPNFDGVPYGVESRDPLDYLKWMLLEASIQTTVTQLVAEAAYASPISDDAIMGRLLALRTHAESYSPSTASTAPFLGIEFVKAVLPDEVLQTLDLTDIIEYRRATADAYEAWQIELGKMAAEIDSVDPASSRAAIENKIAKDLLPRVQAYKNEIANTTDRFFADALKRVVNLSVASVTLWALRRHRSASAGRGRDCS